MDVDLSLDEIIERKRMQQHNNTRTNDKKLHSHGVQMKHKKPLNNKPSGGHARAFDARNKIIEKTRAKIADARDLLNQNIRESGIDARNVLLERKKDRMYVPVSMPPARLKSRVGGFDRQSSASASSVADYGRRTITVDNRDRYGGGHAWDANDVVLTTTNYKPGSKTGSGLAAYASSRLNASAKPFVPRGYVDYDNMQQQEDEEIARSLHLSSYNSSQHPPRSGRDFPGYDMGMEMDDVESAGKGKSSDDPFGIYKSAHNRVDRPSMAPPPHMDRRQHAIMSSSNLPDSLRARLFEAPPSRHVSHGIYANENGRSGAQSQSSSGSSALVMPLPLSAANNKDGYRLLVSNLHTSVTSNDVRELFSYIGPMYSAYVVRPGTAEVIYKSLKHAETAVNVYHHREFDGQPMHCVLVNSHTSSRNASSSSSRTVTTNSSGVEVDIDALHSVLFRDR